MTTSLLDAIVREKSRAPSLRIWSIPCSTGEEPYSIALWLMENRPQVDTYNIEIVGSDIDTRALKAATEGIYGDRALMRLSAILSAVISDRSPEATARSTRDSGIPSNSRGPI